MVGLIAGMVNLESAWREAETWKPDGVQSYSLQHRGNETELYIRLAKTVRARVEAIARTRERARATRSRRARFGRDAGLSWQDAEKWYAIRRWGA